MIRLKRALFDLTVGQAIVCIRVAEVSRFAAYSQMKIIPMCAIPS